MPDSRAIHNLLEADAAEKTRLFHYIEESLLVWKEENPETEGLVQFVQSIIYGLLVILKPQTEDGIEYKMFLVSGKKYIFPHRQSNRTFLLDELEECTLSNTLISSECKKTSLESKIEELILLLSSRQERSIITEPQETERRALADTQSLSCFIDIDNESDTYIYIPHCQVTNDFGSEYGLSKRSICLFGCFFLMFSIYAFISSYDQKT